MNKTLLTGQLLHNPDVFYKNDGFSVAHLHVLPDGEAYPIKILLHNLLAERAKEEFTAGQRLYIEGRLHVRPIGAKLTLECVAFSVTTLL